MKKWEIKSTLELRASSFEFQDLVTILLNNRGLQTVETQKAFLNPKDPMQLTCADVEIEEHASNTAVTRIKKAIDAKESMVVYADYDADGVTAGAILWETLYALGGKVMPYIPHRVDEGYGLSVKGIDMVKAQYNPSLIITVDHGITAWEKVDYAKSLDIEVIVTDHHVKPGKLPDCTIVHTTKLSGAGVSWFFSKEIQKRLNPESFQGLTLNAFLELAAIGTIADLVPLVGPNRSIVSYGLKVINETKRVGLLAILKDAGLPSGKIGTYEISHMIAPRLNAMGRIVHAMDALRLLCTKRAEQASELAQTLGLTNKERQQLTMDTTLHAKNLLRSSGSDLKRKRSDPGIGEKLIFLSHESYNQGVIGLVAGKLVEEFYRPAIVVSQGELYSKASARSIAGFNIVEAIRSCADILVDVGGHPMAAGFTVETKNLSALQSRLEALVDQELDEEKLTRVLSVDTEIPLDLATRELWTAIRPFEPFGFGNPEPVFCSRSVSVVDARLVGAEGKHLKLRLSVNNGTMKQFNNGFIDAIAFNLGSIYGKLQPPATIDIAYTIDMNLWNGNRCLQLKVKDIHV